jgi:alanyl-tRNA synthetase
MAIDGIAFNTATEEGVVADADTVRVVRIEGWDVGACGGTHVSNTREIGPVTVHSRSNPGEGLTRIEFAVGPSAVERRATEHGAALSAAREIGTQVTSLPDAVRRLTEERDRLEDEVAALKDRALTEALTSMDQVEGWRIGVLEGYDANEVGERIQALPDEEQPVLAATGGEGRPYVVVATDGAVPADDLVDAVTERFGGGGGGGPTFAQGGGLDADPEEVAAFLAERAETRK